MTRDQFDRYATPHSVIAALLARLDWPFDRVWEPCCGDGRLADALRAKGAEVIPHDIATGPAFFNWGQRTIMGEWQGPSAMATASPVAVHQSDVARGLSGAGKLARSCLGDIDLGPASLT